jgi:hypothetical protein
MARSSSTPKSRATQTAPESKVQAILVVPKQQHDDIEQRREIRETFHDSQSRTIKGTKK